MAAVDRNSDGSYDAVDSGGFGKDYHGQDAFGERVGDTGIGGSHFGGFGEGHVGLDKDNTGKYEKLSSEALAQTESMSKSAFEADNSNESEEEANSGMRDSLKDLNSGSSEESNNVSSLDTSMLLDEDEDKKAKSSLTDKMSSKEIKEKEAAVEEAKKDLEKALGLKDRIKQNLRKSSGKRTHDYTLSKYNSFLENFSNLGKTVIGSFTDSEIKDLGKEAESLAKELGIDVGDISGIKTLGDTTAPARLDKINKAYRNLSKAAAERVVAAKDNLQKAKSNLDEYKSSFTDKMEESKMEESKEEAKAGPNMSKASVGESDYLTKANKDSTKKEAPSRNDFVNHATDTLKGVTDRIADNTTAKSLGLKSVEEFARENGYDPNKLSTMKAYQSYQNKQIMKTLPSIIKKVGSYITERIKDAFDPSQLPERIRNTLARYNAATLVGAAILSIQSGAGIQASIDQALTMVDPEDQPDVSDYLEDVLNDEGTVADLSNAFDDALAPEQNSDTAELDESIVNIGRKDNTDYSGFNAGLGTTSDADVKVFIARNVKADPILRRMIGKIGK